MFGELYKKIIPTIYSKWWLNIKSVQPKKTVQHNEKTIRKSFCHWFRSSRSFLRTIIKSQWKWKLSSEQQLLCRWSSNQILLPNKNNFVKWRCRQFKYRKYHVRCSKFPIKLSHHALCECFLKIFQHIFT